MAFAPEQCHIRAMDKRLAMLEGLITSGKADSFTWYALALEYKSKGRIDDALDTFSTLRKNDPSYIPMYLMAGAMLTRAGRNEDARDWLKEGIEKANAAGNTHARDEMKKLLDSIA